MILPTANSLFKALVTATVGRYRESGRFVQGFVRGKLLHDPLYRAILALEVLPKQGTLLDLGCGRGILLALLATHRHRPALTLHGMELRAQDARIAHHALQAAAEITQADIRTATLPACAAVMLLDVLMYLGKAEQEALLQKVVNALHPGGVLIMREADAGARLRYWITCLGERCCALARGHWRQSYAYRSRDAWLASLQALGFNVKTYPMSQNTPFANVLYVAIKNPLAHPSAMCAPY